MKSHATTHHRQLPPRTPRLYPGHGGGNNAIVKEDEPVIDCDVAFWKCLDNRVCDDCFFEMKSNQVDWTGVTEHTECKLVISALNTAGLCLNMPEPSKSLFCDTFHSCVYFDDTDDESNNNRNEDNKKNNGNNKIDCDALESCDWEGIKKNWVGDGVCHDSLQGCYNHPICNYDEGDCCEDTCNAPKFSYVGCGSETYACRDPDSANCTFAFNPSCKQGGDNDKKEIPKCEQDEIIYKLIMNDSFGDGWEGTNITITAASASSPSYRGSLKEGATGTEYICLSSSPTCYGVEVGGGDWGREASWSISGYRDGSPTIASGGGLMKCQFPVASDSCVNNCTGQSNGFKPANDPDYKVFKDMTQCIEKECVIQAEKCKEDDACTKCLVEEIPQDCFTLDAFVAVVDCALCQCTESQGTSTCQNKKAPSMILPPNSNTEDDDYMPLPCTPAETRDGSSALMDFSRCMDFDQEEMLLTEFDTNNFGSMDSFEECSHKFNDFEDHGGHSALECLKILVNAMDQDSVDEEAPTKAIAQLAKLVYKNGDKFCNCAKTASEAWYVSLLSVFVNPRKESNVNIFFAFLPFCMYSPLCPHFFNFKTLLYETLDACKALDQIDCDSWDEFQNPCRINIMNKFGTMDLTDNNQCDYMMKENCGVEDPFPAFRREDCQDELPSSSWDFHYEYKKNCLGDEPAPTPATKPPSPQHDVKPSNISPVAPPPTTPSYTPPDDDDDARPSYTPPEEKDKKSKKKSHWFRNLVIVAVLGGIGYYIYKRKTEFNFVRYRRMPAFGGRHVYDDADMYSGLSLESSTNFQPPTLPPTPWATHNNGGYGA